MRSDESIEIDLRVEITAEKTRKNKKQKKQSLNKMASLISGLPVTESVLTT